MATTYPLGPGTLEIGATGTEVDVSCLINNAVLAAEKDQGDSETKLCGTVIPGPVTYTWNLGGNLDLDIAEAAGLWNLSQTAAGTQLSFTFTPNTAAGTSATGKLVIDPLPLGGDETGTTMAADFEWAVVGKPVYTVGGAAVEIGVDSEARFPDANAGPVNGTQGDTSDGPVDVPSGRSERVREPA